MFVVHSGNALRLGFFPLFSFPFVFSFTRTTPILRPRWTRDLPCGERRVLRRWVRPCPSTADLASSPTRDDVRPPPRVDAYRTLNPPGAYSFYSLLKNPERRYFSVGSPSSSLLLPLPLLLLDPDDRLDFLLFFPFLLFLSFFFFLLGA